MGLQHAAAADQVEVVRYLLENGVEVNSGTLKLIRSPEAWEVFLNHRDQLNPPGLKVKREPLL